MATKNVIDHIYDALQGTINTQEILNFVRLGVPLSAFATLGVVEGMATVHKFGRTIAAGAAFGDVWLNGGVYVWPTVASKLEAISGAAADDDGGLGASKITVSGLDANFNRIEEEITMNGLTVTSSTTQSFRRVNRAFVSESGTYCSTTAGSNAGVITIRIAGAGATQCLLGFSDSVGRGQTQIARYTTAVNETGILTSINANVAGTRSAHVSWFKREHADDIVAPFLGARRLIYEVDDLIGNISVQLPHNVKIPPKTDIWVTAHAASAAGSTPVSAQFDIECYTVS